MHLVTVCLPLKVIFITFKHPKQKEELNMLQWKKNTSASDMFDQKYGEPLKMSYLGTSLIRPLGNNKGTL